MAEQKNIGSKNINTSNSNNSITCIVNINGENINIDILKVLDSITRVFEKEDKTINEILPNKILVNKTNHHESYQTVKIITSLLQIGIPLPATYEIAQSTIARIKKHVRENKKTDTELTTKDIRKMVLESIQEISITRFPYSEIENWNNQYIRRYGHNNKRIQVYYNNNDNLDNISYEFINKVLLHDLIIEISKGKINEQDISVRFKKEVSSEILSFINSCDLYKINYDVLKSIIKEIALQPPHPWFINDITQREILEYDVECLENNLEKLKTSLEKNEDSLQSVKIEVLHHASALILEKYNYFLGCYDLSSFYLLKDLLLELIDPGNWDLAVDYSKVSTFLSDLSFSQIDINDFLEVIERINKLLSIQQIHNIEFDRLLMHFSDFAIRLFKLGYKQQVSLFLNSNWNRMPSTKVIENLKLLLYSLFPIKKWNLDITKKNYFWINYKSIRSDVISNIKNQVLVVYNDGSLTDYGFLELLKKAKTSSFCNIVLAISEKESDAIKTCEEIEDYLCENNMGTNYMTFWIDKLFAQKIFDSNNKMKALDEIVFEQASLS